MASKKDGTHPQYKVNVATDGGSGWSLQQQPHGGGVTARFGVFRDLDERITSLNGGRPCGGRVPFPPTLSKQQWGFTLSPEEERARAAALDVWLQSVLSNEIEAVAAKECATFLGVADDRINTGR